MTDLLKKIKTLCRQAGINICDLEKRSGVSIDRMSVESIEDVPADDLYSIAEALDVTIEAIETGQRQVEDDFDPSRIRVSPGRSWD